jgi:hypothetical protein
MFQATDTTRRDSLYLGLDPAATNHIDSLLGEEEQPPGGFAMPQPGYPQPQQQYAPQGMPADPLAPQLCYRLLHLIVVIFASTLAFFRFS